MAKQRMIYALALLTSFGLFVMWEDYIVHLLFYFLLVLPVLSLAASLPLCFLLRWRLNAPGATVAKNTPATFCLCVQNLYPVPALCIKATVVCKNALSGTETAAKEKIRFSVGFSTGTEVPIALSFPYCGKVTMCVKRLFVCDLLGLFSLPVIHKQRLCACTYVMPDLEEVECETESGVDLGQESAIYSDKKPGNDPAEIFRLRDYRPGDRPHSIHWKLSNRMNRLIVREFGLPLNISLHFLLERENTLRLEQTDQLLGALFSLANFLAEQGMIQTVHWLSSPQMLETRTVTDENTLAETLHELLAAPSVSGRSGALTAFAQEEATKGCHLIYLADSSQADAAAPLLLHLLHSGICRRISVLTAGDATLFAELAEEPCCEIYSLCSGLEAAGLEEMRV